MKKRIVTAAAVAAISVAGLSAGAAYATTDADTSDPMSSLVTAIASEFNLKATDVQAVFDEQRTQMEAVREQEVKDKVAALVTDGKLTQAQADKINAKRAELKAQREADRDSMDDKTSDERKAAMETKKTELKAWLEENDIDSTYAYLLMGGHGRSHGGHGMGEPRGEASTESTN